jgi:hypothetical protein
MRQESCWRVSFRCTRPVKSKLPAVPVARIAATVDVEVAQSDQVVMERVGRCVPSPRARPRSHVARRPGRLVSGPTARAG